MAKILLVDDDHEIVRLVKAYLEKAGFQVLAAYNGETALHILRRKIEPDPKKPVYIQTIYGVGYKFLDNKILG